ncbi:hypothetical protein [Noviherbaspirillum cavernae]|uniref:hypothetical protein n=1 Tax=Noviherbaspirillum cavernae TaxID=2320862 RepID=UPI0011C3B130|nr:hypothetical protein [Noviherbaspirillum cavernae]
MGFLEQESCERIALYRQVKWKKRGLSLRASPSCDLLPDGTLRDVDLREVTASSLRQGVV